MRPATSSNAILNIPIQFTISCTNLVFQCVSGRAESPLTQQWRTTR
jgi:hypothetical protein